MHVEVAKSDKKIDLEFSDVQIIHTFAGRVIASHSACKFPADSMGDDDDDDDGSICLHSLLLFYTVSQQAPQKARYGVMVRYTVVQGHRNWYQSIDRM